MIEMPVMTRSIASPPAAATAMDRLMPIALAEIAPALNSSTCLLSDMDGGLRR